MAAGPSFTRYFTPTVFTINLFARQTERKGGTVYFSFFFSSFLSLCLLFLVNESGDSRRLHAPSVRIFCCTRESAQRVVDPIIDDDKGDSSSILLRKGATTVLFVHKHKTGRTRPPPLPQKKKKRRKKKRPKKLPTPKHLHKYRVSKMPLETVIPPRLIIHSS